MADNSKYIEDIKKYTGGCDEDAVAGIVRYLGIALRNRDSSLVSATDPKELGRVRDSWLKKKLGLTDSDDTLDAAIAKVMEAMKGNNHKSRVTVYYMLADAFGKLADMHPKK